MVVENWSNQISSARCLVVASRALIMNHKQLFAYQLYEMYISHVAVIACCSSEAVYDSVKHLKDERK